MRHFMKEEAMPSPDKPWTINVLTGTILIDLKILKPRYTSGYELTYQDAEQLGLDLIEASKKNRLDNKGDNTNG